MWTSIVCGYLHVSVYTYFWFPEYGCGFIPRRPERVARSSCSGSCYVLLIYANMILFHLSWSRLDLSEKLKAEKFFVPEDPCRMFLQWRSRSDCRNVPHKSYLFEVKIKHPHAGVFLLFVFVIGFLVVVTCATIAFPSWSARRGVAWTLLGHSSGCSVKMLLAAALTNQLG